MKKLLKNQSGFSMVNVLMAAAMAGGVALVIAQLGKNAANVTKNATHSSEINEAYNRIQKYFLHSKSCAKSLEVLYNSNSFTAEQNQIPIGEKRYLSSIKTFFGPDGAEIEKEFFEVGKAIGAGSRVVTNEIELTRIDAENLEVKIEFDKDPDPVKKRTITKTFSLNASFTGNAITKCFSQLDSAVFSSCATIGGTIIGGECKNSKICDLEKFSYANSYAGGTTTSCSPNETVEGMGLYKNLHSTYACEGMGGLVINLLGVKYCQFSGDCPSNWLRRYSKTTPNKSKGYGGPNCAEPSCTTGSHSNWGLTIETCTHAKERKKKNFLDDCDNYGSITAYANIVATACY